MTNEYMKKNAKPAFHTQLFIAQEAKEHWPDWKTTEEVSGVTADGKWSVRILLDAPPDESGYCQGNVYFLSPKAEEYKDKKQWEIKQGRVTIALVLNEDVWKEYKPSLEE